MKERVGDEKLIIINVAVRGIKVGVLLKRLNVGSRKQHHMFYRGNSYGNAKCRWGGSKSATFDRYQFCCSINRGTMGVNSLPKTVTRQLRGCDLNPGPTTPESSTLTTRF